MLVGRSPDELHRVEQEIRRRGGRAVSFVADLSDVTSARHAALEIAALDLPIAGLLNNAGVHSQQSFKSARGWEGNARPTISDRSP